MTIKKKPTKKEAIPKKSYGPCSEKQRLILQDTSTDVILMGGGAGKLFCPLQ